MCPEKPQEQTALDALVNACVAFTRVRGKILYQTSNSILESLIMEYEGPRLVLYFEVQEWLGLQGDCLVIVTDRNSVVLRAQGHHEMGEAYDMQATTYTPGDWEKAVCDD